MGEQLQLTDVVIHRDFSNIGGNLQRGWSKSKFLAEKYIEVLKLSMEKYPTLNGEL